MSQTFHTPWSPDQEWTEAMLDADDNWAALRSLFAGTSEPTSPVEGQPYWDSTANQFYIYDGSAWQAIPATGGGSAPMALLATVTGIDGTATGTTTLLTATGDTVIDKVVLRVTAIDTLTVNPEWGVGVAAGEDDVISPADFSIYTDLSATGQTMELRANAISRIVASAEVLKLGIDTAATAVTLTLTAYVFGTILS